MKHEAKIRWAWGLEEVKIFDTKEECGRYLDKHEDDIISCVGKAVSGRKNSSLINKTSKIDGTYCPMRGMSDYEMDMLL
jgi:hypothetical protein